MENNVKNLMDELIDKTRKGEIIWKETSYMQGISFEAEIKGVLVCLTSEDYKEYFTHLSLSKRNKSREPMAKPFNQYFTAKIPMLLKETRTLKELIRASKESQELNKKCKQIDEITEMLKSI